MIEGILFNQAMLGSPGTNSPHQKASLRLPDGNGARRWYSGTDLVDQGPQRCNGSSFYLQVHTMPLVEGTQL